MRFNLSFAMVCMVSNNKPALNDTWDDGNNSTVLAVYNTTAVPEECMTSQLNEDGSVKIMEDRVNIIW